MKMAECDSSSQSIAFQCEKSIATPRHWSIIDAIRIFSTMKMRLIQSHRGRHRIIRFCVIELSALGNT